MARHNRVKVKLYVIIKLKYLSFLIIQLTSQCLDIMQGTNVIIYKQ